MEWIIIGLVVLLLFGGKKIPELAKGLGSGIKNFKKAVKEDDEPVEIASNDEPKATASVDTAEEKTEAKA